jgi:ribose/xylose/arabinose/galactoside ABC-type transport system permease subunit
VTRSPAPDSPARAPGDPGAGRGPESDPGAAAEAAAAHWISKASRYWAYLFLVLLVAFFAIAADSFATLNTTQIILVAASIPLVTALGQTIVIIGAGIDLSVAYTVGLTAVVAALLTRSFAGDGVPVLLAVIAGASIGLAASAIAGAINGVVIAKVGVPPFIMTLGMLGIAQGVALLLGDGLPVAGLPRSISTFGNGYVFNFSDGSLNLFSLPEGTGVADSTRILPNVVLMAIVLVAALHYLLSTTRFGQHVYAIGGNTEAARRAGVPVNRVIVASYVLSALLAGCAGIISMVRFQTGQPDAGEQVLLTSLAAVVIGGTSLFGGTGTILGTVVGALIIAVLQTGLILMDVAPFWQYIAVGVVIILAVIVTQARQQVVDRALRAGPARAGGAR